jgi:hypothetical protein
MKKVRILVLVLACILAVGILSSCSSEKVTAKVTITIDADDDAILTNYELTVEGTAETPPTVLQAMREAMTMREIAYVDSEESIESILSYVPYEDEAFSYYWDYTVNGVAPSSGRSNSYVIKDGDVIRYFFYPLDKAKITG